MTAAGEGDRDEEQLCMALVKSHTDWEKELERLLSEAERAKASERTTKIFIDKDGKRFHFVLLVQRPLTRTIRNIKPLLHRVRLAYDGHCWGFYVGFEEKRYREYGNNKSERYFVFSFRLDSIGSFAQRIKQPAMLERGRSIQ